MSVRRGLGLALCPVLVLITAAALLPGSAAAQGATVEVVGS